MTLITLCFVLSIRLLASSFAAPASSCPPATMTRYVALLWISFFWLTSSSSAAQATRAVELQLWDMAGLERFRPQTGAYYQGAAAACLVFDVTSADSFASLPRWLAELRGGRPADRGAMALMLVANKNDREADRAISPAAVQALATTYDMSYAEVSARTGDGVRELFQQLAQHVYETSHPAPSAAAAAAAAAATPAAAASSPLPFSSDSLVAAACGLARCIVCLEDFTPSGPTG